MRDRALLLLSCVFATVAVSGGQGQEVVGRNGAAPDHAIAQAFQTRLAAYRNWTWDQWTRSLPPPAAELDQPQLDIANTDFLLDVQRELGLCAEDLEILTRHGLVLVDPQGERSFPAAYYNLYTRDLPLLITTDSILHAFHHSYDKILLQLESDVIVPKLTALLGDVHVALSETAAAHPHPELTSVYQDVDLYLAVARTLLKDSASIPTVMDQDADVRVIVQSIQDAGREPIKRVMIYGGERPIDFSQFAVRGHYTRSPTLQQYFRCMTWLGRPDCGWHVLPTDTTTGVASTGSRELRAAVLLAQLMRTPDMQEQWKSIEAILGFLVGDSDNLTASKLWPVLEQAGIETPEALLDHQRMGAVQTALSSTGAAEQAIRSQALWKPPGSATPVRPPSIFQLFGQRFAIDSFALSQVVHDAIVFDGVPMARMMPSGLDVMAALGNDLAVRLQEPELRRWHYAGNLAALRDVVAGLPAHYWEQNVYGGWLNALRELNVDLSHETALPQVFRSAAWQRKQLQTQLASWSELRHDTLLYAKASYSVPQCEVPAAYVEPYPRFYAALARIARRAAQQLDGVPAPASRYGGGWFRQQPTTETYTVFYGRMAEHLETLERLALKEIAQQPFTPAEQQFLQTTISQRGNVLFGSGALTVQVYDGWYTSLIYGFNEEIQNHWQATIADVHTDLQHGQVLEVGVGRVNYCVAVIDQRDHPTAFVGPVYSYYEFPQPISDRMTDEQWQMQIQKRNLPPRPAFITPLVSTRAAQLQPMVDAQRIGPSLKVNLEDHSRPNGRRPDLLIEISRQGFTTLAKVAPGLRYLDASQTPIVDDDLQPLASLESLKAIDLNGTAVNGSGLVHLNKSRSVRQLFLQHTKMSDVNLAVIENWPYLEKLDLSHTPISDQGLAPLTHCRYLRELDLRGTHVTEGGVATLRAALPECRIEGLSAGGIGQRLPE